MAFATALFFWPLVVLAQNYHAFKDEFSIPLPEGSEIAIEVVTGSWTHRPECISAGSSEFCLFTNSEFSNGRGISIITSPTAIESIQWLQLFANSTSTDGLNRDGGLPFHQSLIPGSGMGLVADRTIAKGERLTAWTPLIVVHDEASDSLSSEALGKLQDLAVERMNKKHKAAFLAQHGQWGGHLVSDIMKTNSFLFEGFGGMSGGHVANFPEVSRFNHACRPNVEYNFNPKTLAQYTFATRTIHPGEELTISYTDIMRPRYERIHNLRTGWGFTCTCSHCSRSLAEIDQSDERIRRINDIIHTCADAWNTTNLWCTLDRAVELVLLHEEENTGGKILSWAYWQAKLAAEAFGLESLVTKYSQLAWDCTGDRKVVM